MHKEFSIINIPYEMFITIQLIYLTCRKDNIQSPTRKEGRDLFRRTIEVSSRNNPRMKNNMTIAGISPCYRGMNGSLLSIG